MQGDRFLLNGRPYLLRMVLDQGYWPDGGLTAPDDDALKRDVELARAMGFNGVRKHQKIEDPRYLYWADTSACWSGKRCPAPTALRQQSVERLSTRMDGRDRARLQPSVHHGVGADQRVLGRARICPTIPASGTTSRRCTT